jgi:hypothetical protein
MQGGHGGVGKGLGTEEPRVLRLVLRREDGEHRREGLRVAVGELQRVSTAAGIAARAAEDALAALWPSGTAFMRPAPCSRPSRRRSSSASRARGAGCAAASAKATGQVGAGASGQLREARIVAARLASHSTSERPICSRLLPQLAVFARCVTQRSARRALRSRRCHAAHRLRDHGEVAAAEAQCSWSSSQSPPALRRHRARLDRRFEPFGVAEAANGKAGEASHINCSSEAALRSMCRRSVVVVAAGSMDVARCIVGVRMPVVVVVFVPMVVTMPLCPVRA